MSRIGAGSTARERIERSKRRSNDSVGHPRRLHRDTGTIDRSHRSAIAGSRTLQNGVHARDARGRSGMLGSVQIAVAGVLRPNLRAGQFGTQRGQSSMLRDRTA